MNKTFMNVRKNLFIASLSVIDSYDFWKIIDVKNKIIKLSNKNKI